MPMMFGTAMRKNRLSIASYTCCVVIAAPGIRARQYTTLKMVCDVRDRPNTNPQILLV